MIQPIAQDRSPASLEQGIQHGVTFEDYQAIRALNQSTLKMLDPAIGTPLHARAAFDGQLKLKSTDALRLGQREHCWVVEGEPEFRRRFRIAEACNALIQSGPRKGLPCGCAATRIVNAQWKCGTHAKDVPEELDYVSPEDVDRIRNMGESIRQHEINVHLKRPGWSEATLVYNVDVQVGVSRCPQCHGWEHPKKFKVGFEKWKCWRCGESIMPKVSMETVSLLHKTRVDRLAEPTAHRPHLIIELKRMQVLKGARFEREKVIRNYGWDVQAAMETEAVKTVLNVDACELVWLFVEEQYPHDVTWFPASEDTLRVGREKLWRYRKTWAQCELSGSWPGRCVGSQVPGGLSDKDIKSFLKEYADDNGRLPSEVSA